MRRESKHLLVVFRGRGKCTNLGQTRQINQRQVQDVGRVDFEVDGMAVDALIVTRNSCSLILNFSLDIGKVRKPPAWDVDELGPLRTASGCGRFIRVALGIGRTLIFSNIH